MALTKSDITALKEIFQPEDDPVTKVSKTIPAWAYAVGITVLGFLGSLMLAALLWFIQSWLSDNKDLPDRVRNVETQMEILVKEQEQRKLDSILIQKLSINMESVTSSLADLENKTDKRYTSLDAEEDKKQTYRDMERGDKAAMVEIEELKATLKDRTLFMEDTERRLRQVEIADGRAVPK